MSGEQEDHDEYEAKVLPFRDVTTQEPPFDESRAEALFREKAEEHMVIMRQINDQLGVNNEAEKLAFHRLLEAFTLIDRKLDVLLRRSGGLGVLEGE
jgi:hypothetical protein